VNQYSWNANYVAILGKKCWMITHTQTRYTVLVPDVTAKEIENLQILFFECLMNQLSLKQLVQPEQIRQFIGEIVFYPTNNDRSCIAYNNRRIEDISYWKSKFYHFQDIPFSKIGVSINEIGTKLTDGKSKFICANADF
jgi:hypothetical protein